MRMRHAAVVAGLALGLMSGAAKAAYIVNIEQMGANVVATGSGSIDTSQFGAPRTLFGPDNIASDHAFLIIGAYSQNQPFEAESYQGTILGPVAFGTGGDTLFSFGSGNNVGIAPGVGGIIVPLNYESGTDLKTSTATATNTTLAALGLTAGTSAQYLFAGNAETLDTFTINVLGSVSAVPLPASAPMFGAALLALGVMGYSVKRKKAAAAA